MILAALTAVGIRFDELKLGWLHQKKAVAT
jgi:hypothetical protein